jgi:hypothetical protein
MKTTHLTSLLVAAVAASQLGATDCGQVITDRGFDLWCGDRLCYWKLERGEVAQVPTWVDGDDGVELVGDDVAISQLTSVDSNDGACIEFHLVADIDQDAEVTLEADIFGDDTVDWSERLPSASWERLSLRVGIAGRYDGIRFRLTKQGSGHAVLAAIGAEIAQGCPSFVDPISYPLGATCSTYTDCDSGLCIDGVCSSCGGSGGCDPGEVCGAESHAPGNLVDWYECVPASSKPLGEPCHSSGECASNICNDFVCSECIGGANCSAGVACGTESSYVFIDMCDPGGGARPAGADCATDNDCASGACAGTPVGYCDDWVPHPTCYNDTECGLQSDGTPATCILNAVAGGTCQ